MRIAARRCIGGTGGLLSLNLPRMPSAIVALLLAALPATSEAVATTGTVVPSKSLDEDSEGTSSAQTSASSLCVSCLKQSRNETSR